MSVSLATALAARDNDYRTHAIDFTTRTGLGWHDPTPAVCAADTALSVVIPACNNAYSLPTVLDALAAQDTDGRTEVIVIDDASDDNTPKIIAGHPVVDLAYRLPERVGAAGARSLGIYLASHATVVFLDADMVLSSHVLADIAARTHPRLVQVGFRHNIAYQPLPDGRAVVPDGEPDLAADHRVRWAAPAGVPMFYSGAVYQQPFVGRPLDHTRELIDLGNAATYYDWDLPRMVVTALVAAPRAALSDIGGFAPEFDAAGWGTEDTHLGAALIAVGCKVAPLRQARGYHIDPPDPAAVWQAKFATAPARIDIFRQLLTQPAPMDRGRCLVARAEQLLHRAEALR